MSQNNPLPSDMPLSKDMLHQKLKSLHLKPLAERWNLAQRPEQYKWSSAQFYDNGHNDLGILTHFMDSI